LFATKPNLDKLKNQILDAAASITPKNL